MAQICTGYYNGRVRYLFLADFHGLFSRGLALICFFLADWRGLFSCGFAQISGFYLR
jgi:hypothetical protein